MRIVAALAAAVTLTACPARATEAVAAVEIVRDGDSWTADYRFQRAAPVWVFAVSPLTRVNPRSFRKESWTVETPGVRLERRGWYDVLVADKGNVPDRVRVRFRPFTEDIETASDAAMAFTDGSVALYSVQWKASPAASLAEVERYPADMGFVPSFAPPTSVTLRDTAGPILVEGRRVERAVLTGDRETYVLFGQARAVERPTLTTIIDPATPDWLKQFTLSSLPPIFDRYARLLGPRSRGRPTLMVSWNGATPGRTSFGGSVLPGQMVLRLEGEGLTRENPRLREIARWFVAHEAAHFWLGQAVIYESNADLWITEGGADLLAYRTVAALNPSFNARAALQQALDDCIAATRSEPMITAVARNQPKVHYNCGAVLGLVAERAWGGEFHRFVRQLIAANQDDKQVSRGEWLSLLDSRTPGLGLGQRIGSLLDNPNPGPQPWADLLAAGGIKFRLRADGSPELL